MGTGNSEIQHDDTTNGMSLERVGITNALDSKTWLHLAVRNLPNQGEGFLFPAKGAYFTDSRGARYDMASEDGEYSGEPLNRQVKLSETYRFAVDFPKVDYQTPYVYFYHPQFKPIKVNLKW